MYKRLKEVFSPPSKQLDEDFENSTDQFTPITIKNERATTSTTSITTADLNTAVTTILSHESSEKEFKNLADLSLYPIQAWLLKWNYYNTHAGLKPAISFLNPGDIIRICLKEKITKQKLTDKYINNNSAFVKYLQEWNISTILSVTEFFEDPDLLMTTCDHYSKYTSKNVNAHISHFLEVLDTNEHLLYQLDCTEKDKAAALINSLQPLIFRKRVSEQKGKTIEAVLDNIQAVITTFELFHNIDREVKSSRQKHKPGLSTETKQSTGSVDGYKANNAVNEKFSAVQCTNCSIKGHYATWCTEVCQRCSPNCDMMALECPKALAIAKAEKATYDAKRKAKVIIKSNNILLNTPIPTNNINTLHTIPTFLYDTGANINCITDDQLLQHTSASHDTQTSISTITTANNNKISVKQGVFFDQPCLHTPSFNNNLVTHDFLTNNNNNVIMIYNNLLHIIPITKSNKENIGKISSDISSIHIKPNKDNLFFLSYNELDTILSNKCTTLPTVIPNTNIPTSILPTLSINSVFYKTVELSNIERIVTFWHEALGHPNKKTMINIVRGGLLHNLPPELSIQAIQQNFPLCHACAIATLSTKPGGQPILKENRKMIEIGEEWEIDCKKYSGNTATPTLSIGGNHFAITAICRKSGYTITSTESSTKHIMPFIKSIFTEAN